MHDVTDRPFGLPADSIELTLDIPTPPSVNATRRIDFRGHKKFKAWKKQAGLHVLANGQLRKAGIPGKYELTITLNEKLCKLDPGNAEKACSDFLVSLGMIIDDGPKYARRIIIQWGEAPDGVRLTVRSLHHE